MLIESVRTWATRRRYLTPPAADVARGLLAARQALRQHLPVELLHDPTVEMLLSLLIAEADGAAMGAAELGTTTTVGPVVASRWIKAMIGLGLIELQREIVALTPSGRAAVYSAMAAVSSAQAKKYVRRPRLRLLSGRNPGSAGELILPAVVEG